MLYFYHRMILEILHLDTAYKLLISFISSGFTALEFISSRELLTLHPWIPGKSSSSKKHGTYVYSACHLLSVNSDLERANVKFCFDWSMCRAPCDLTMFSFFRETHFLHNRITIYMFYAG